MSLLMGKRNDEAAQTRACTLLSQNPSSSFSHCFSLCIFWRPWQTKEPTRIGEKKERNDPTQHLSSLPGPHQALESSYSGLWKPFRSLRCLGHLNGPSALQSSQAAVDLMLVPPRSQYPDSLPEALKQKLRSHMAGKLKNPLALSSR